MSGVFHLLEPQGSARDVLQRLDHAGIFFLIAGSFTAVHGILFRGIWRWGMLLLIWAIAITSITLKTIYFHDLSEWLGLSLYLGMGWLGAITGVLLYRRFGFVFIKPLVYGALAYTAGAVIEFIRMPVLIPGVIGPHELFHIAVLIGLGYHFAFVSSFIRNAIPFRQTIPQE
jgi:channel protein (hemolysin III family)